MMATFAHFFEEWVELGRGLIQGQQVADAHRACGLARRRLDHASRGTPVADEHRRPLPATFSQSGATGVAIWTCSTRCHAAGRFDEPWQGPRRGRTDDSPDFNTERCLRARNPRIHLVPMPSGFAERVTTRTSGADLHRRRPNRASEFALLASTSSRFFRCCLKSSKLSAPRRFGQEIEVPFVDLRQIDIRAPIAEALDLQPIARSLDRRSRRPGFQG